MSSTRFGYLTQSGFDNDGSVELFVKSVKINGSGSEYMLPTTQGLNNQVITSSGDGNTLWKDSSGFNNDDSVNLFVNSIRVKGIEIPYTLPINIDQSNTHW